MVSLRQLNLISQILLAENITLSDLLCAYITGTSGIYELTGHAYILCEELCRPSTLNRIVGTLLITPQTSSITTCIARNITVRSYILEIGRLLAPSAGFHFHVAHASPLQFSQFSSVKMAKAFEDTCPTLWQLFGALLNAVAMQNPAVSANNRGNYLTEIAYRDGEDMPTPSKGQKGRAMDQTVSETVDDMPDEDWGRQLEDDDSSDEGMEAGEGETAMELDGVQMPGRQRAGVWSAKTGALWQTGTGSVAQRQLQRTHVVSQPSKTFVTWHAHQEDLATNHTVQYMHEQQQYAV
jgi:hypothetical protein